MLWFKHTGKDPSWIIIASAYAPDLDIRRGAVQKIGYEHPHQRRSHKARGFSQHSLPAAFRHRGGACAKAGGHEVRGFVPVRWDWVRGAYGGGCVDREPGISILLADNKAKVGDRDEQVYC